jgi:hypothetical protein
MPRTGGYAPTTASASRSPGYRVSRISLSMASQSTPDCEGGHKRGEQRDFFEKKWGAGVAHALIFETLANYARLV